MTKELQDHVWKHCLPKEFKEEVKKLYIETEIELSKKKGASDNLTQQLRGMNRQLAYLFGYHNLTSDAEGEEMLIISRREIQQLVVANDIVILKAAGIDNIETIQAKTVNTILNRLFGSKCLPTEADDLKVPEPKCKHFKDGKCAHPAVSHIENGKLVKGAECDVSSCEDVEYEPNPAEPKLHKGNKVIFKPTGKVKVVFDYKDTGWYLVALPNFQSPMWVNESDLEPYTEPEGNIAENHNLSQHCDKSSDNPQSDKTKASTNHFGDSNEMVNDSEASLTKVPPNPSLI